MSAVAPTLDNAARPTLNGNDAHGGNMDDLEATRLCAEAMGFDWKLIDSPDFPAWISIPENYLPLKNDAQAMALVKRFRLDCVKSERAGIWNVFLPNNIGKQDADLNRAIVYCVAAMQAAKK